MQIKNILLVGHSLNSPFIPAIISTLKTLGYKVTFFDQYRPDLFSKSLGFISNTQTKIKQITSQIIDEYVNRKLYQVAVKHKPDLVFVFKGRNITPETVQKIRNNSLPIINWYPDYYDDWTWIKNNAANYTYFFTPCEYIQKELKKIGVTSYYIPFAAEADAHFISWPKRNQATFVGRFTERRNKLFRKVYEADLLDIWGYSHWQNSFYKSVYHGQVTPDQCREIIRRSSITLNTLTATDDVPIKSVNYRVFEASGVGGFVLSWYNYPLEKFFKLGKEIETFKSADEALEKTKFYLKYVSAREKIASAGWSRTKKDHTYQIRLNQLLTLIK